jgi:ubiquinone/menaquinone biosynthesis C-methylase UbiE
MLRKHYFNLLYLFSEPPWDTGVSPPELLDFIEHHPPGNAIDIGCGTGTNVITLAQSDWKVTGVDFAPHAIKIAKHKLRRGGIRAELVVRDATNLNGITGPFDLALDMGCFHGLRDKKADYLSELERILAPGGHWLMYGFFKPDTDPASPGLAEADLKLILASLELVWRQDGLEKEERPSAWFLYRKE